MIHDFKPLFASLLTLLFSVVDWSELLHIKNIGDAIMWVLRALLLIVTIRYTAKKAASLKKPPKQ